MLIFDRCTMSNSRHMGIRVLSDTKGWLLKTFAKPYGAVK